MEYRQAKLAKFFHNVATHFFPGRRAAVFSLRSRSEVFYSFKSNLRKRRLFVPRFRILILRNFRRMPELLIHLDIQPIFSQQL